MALALRYAARSDSGLIRGGNEDSGYAGPRLLAVADGMGGHAAGEVARTVAIAALAALDEDAPGRRPARPALRSRRRSAPTTHLRDMVDGRPRARGHGHHADRAAVGRRAARPGARRRLPRLPAARRRAAADHPRPHLRADAGRRGPDHRRRRPTTTRSASLLMRALDGREDVEPDLSVREARAGDRYLLCSDGLSGVVSDETLRDTLADDADARGGRRAAGRARPARRRPRQHHRDRRRRRRGRARPPSAVARSSSAPRPRAPSGSGRLDDSSGRQARPPSADPPRRRPPTTDAADGRRPRAAPPPPAAARSWCWPARRARRRRAYGAWPLVAGRSTTSASTGEQRRRSSAGSPGLGRRFALSRLYRTSTDRARRPARPTSRTGSAATSPPTACADAERIVAALREQADALPRRWRTAASADAAPRPAPPPSATAAPTPRTDAGAAEHADARHRRRHRVRAGGDGRRRRRRPDRAVSAGPRQPRRTPPGATPSWCCSAFAVADPMAAYAVVGLAHDGALPAGMLGYGARPRRCCSVVAHVGVRTLRAATPTRCCCRSVALLNGLGLASSTGSTSPTPTAPRSSAATSRRPPPRSS